MPNICFTGIMDEPVQVKTSKIKITWRADFTCHLFFNFSIKDTNFGGKWAANIGLSKFILMQFVLYNNLQGSYVL